MSEFTHRFSHRDGSADSRFRRWPGSTAKVRLLSILLVLQVPAIAAQDATGESPPAIDTSDWACDYCAFEEGWSVEIGLGLGNVSDDSYKFGEYNGLHEQGSYPIGEASARYRGEDAAYLDLEVSDLGLDSRSLAIEAGRQGRYAVYLQYDEIPHYISDSASSPYLGNGGSVLTLPSGWVNAASTAGMTALSGSLQDVDLKTERKRIGSGLSITTESPWSYDIALRHEDKDGNKPGGGAFLTSSMQLVEPVDYATDEIDASVSYTSKRWQGRFAYYASVFSNGNESLRWENAYTPIVAGADEGQLALPPDNEFHQLSLSLAYLINDRNHLSGDFSVGHMQQDEKLLQATLNSALAVGPLPADSADAEVDTTDARLRYASSITDKLDISAAYSFSERDNKTPELMYEWVSTDALVNSQRANLPYSYTRNSFDIKADYSYARGIGFGVGYEIDDRERSFQEVDETSEESLWGKIRLRNIDRLFIEIKLATGSRDASAAEAVAAIDPPQNTLMSKYNTADRDRDSIGVFISYMPSSTLSFSVGIDQASDDYRNSELGLTDSEDRSVNFDVTALLSETVSLNTYLSRQQIESTQTNSQGFSSADWLASTEDNFDNFGIGLNFVVVEDSMDVGIDFNIARSTGDIEVDSGAPAGVFPQLETDLETWRLYLAYRVNENLSLQAAYWHETYDVSDWAVDGVDVDTVANLLSFGQQEADYSIDVVKLAMQYRF